KEQTNIIDKGCDTPYHLIRGYREENIKLLNNLNISRPDVIPVYAKTWFKINKLYPRLKKIISYKSRAAALIAISKKEHNISSNNGLCLYVGQKVICYYEPKYGGVEERKIKKITNSGIYFEGVKN